MPEKPRQSNQQGEPMSQRMNAEMLAGAIFIMIGAAFLLGSFELSFGSLRRIGPAGFPAMIATGLIIMGGIVLWQALKSAKPREAMRFHPGKLGVIILSIVIFGLTVRGAGLLVAVALCCFTSSFASRPYHPFRMGIYGLLLGGACSLAFIKGLGMPVAVIGPWFGM